MTVACFFVPLLIGFVSVTLVAGGNGSKGVMKNGTCAFINPPAEMPFFWDPSCEVGKLGCFADGKHVECRFCGKQDYKSISCPETAVLPPFLACDFEVPTPENITAYWEPRCKMGIKGCMADGINVQCRFCGVKPYHDISCPSRRCMFRAPPKTKYYWDQECKFGHLGCLADGIHSECRFCGEGAFDSITCPPGTPPVEACFFEKGEPSDAYYWEPKCILGMLGCWADSFHPECRFCGGSGDFATVPCPSSSEDLYP
jgi:hypothetical protein